ncbi:ras guanine nucleotide exchange factor domain-containing protein [Mycena leptocephala]|nr:ras guanine nucleotide exchange factor domain-containing protein [Mycena leptocephala]
MTSPPVCRRLVLMPLPSAQLVPVVDQEGLLQKGSLAALVKTLCRPWTENNPIGIGPEKTFQDVFLMTFRTFTTAESLLRMLIARYHTKCPRLASELEEEKLQLRAQRRILTLLSMLWQGTTLTLTEKESMTNTFTDFLQCIPPPFSKTAQLITSMVNVEGAQIQGSSVGQQSQRPTNDEQDLSRRNSHHIAEQLTLREFTLYSKITPQECIPSQSQGQNLDAFRGSYDNTVTWIKTSILKGKRVGDRADMVNVWIQIAVKCRELANFFSMSAIITALSSSVIEGLKSTWFVVPSSSRSLLDRMRHFNDPVGGFSQYRNLVETAQGPSANSWMFNDIPVQSSVPPTKLRLSC